MSLKGNKIVIAELNDNLFKAVSSDSKLLKTTIEMLVLDYVKKNVDKLSIITAIFGSNIHKALIKVQEAEESLVKALK